MTQGGAPDPTNGNGADGAGAGGLSRLVANLAMATDALSALSAALSLRLAGARAAPAVERALSEVVVALGVDDLLGFERSELEPLSQLVRARVHSACDLSLNPRREPGSAAGDPESIEAAALGADTVAPFLPAAILPRLPGLTGRLAEPGSAFLELDPGAGGMVVSLCRAWPRLAGTVIDVREPVLAAARRRVAAAGLASRVSLRRQDVAELRDRDAYDLAWLSTSSIPPAALPRAAACVLTATRPGGWLILNMHGGDDELPIALARLRTAREGGTLLWPSEAESLLVEAGWDGVHRLSSKPIPALWMVAGRRGAKAQRRSRAEPPATLGCGETPKGPVKPKEEL